jgi:DNA-binding transcriptional LysR family regulator
MKACGALFFNRLFRGVAFAMGMPVDLARLPPLDLLRGFVAVCRRMSITLAARDLFLTQSAVSRQIHALEARLGVRLLVEEGRLLWLAPPRPSRATTHAYWLVPAEEQPRSEVRAVAEWIQNEAAGSEGQ